MHTDIQLLNYRGERLVGTLTWPTEKPPAPGCAEASGGAADMVPGQQQPQQQQQEQQRHRCVILAHGYMSGRDSELLIRLATALAREGLASLRFDFSGNGDSEGRFRYGHYWSEAEEIHCAKEHLESCHGCRVVGLLGHSKGATSTLLYASKYQDVTRVVNLAGRFDVRQNVKRRLGGAALRQLAEEGRVLMSGRSRSRGEFFWELTDDDLRDRLGTDVAAACACIPEEVRVLTCHGTGDADVPVSESSKFASAIKSHELLVIEGGDHRFSGMGTLMQLVPRVTEFLSSAP